MAKKKALEKEKKEMGFANFYKNNYKKFLVLPILLFLFSLSMIFVAIQRDGTPIYRDVSLRGGLSAVVETESLIEADELVQMLKERFPENSFVISELMDDNTISGFIIDTDLEDDKLFDALNDLLESEIVVGENYNSNFISPTLSNAFFKQAIYILVISFVMMSVVVFLYFREIVPSLAMVLSAIFDTIVTIGVLNAFGFRISIAGIGAIIMLIGYSIDTDVLLANRLIKEKGGNFFKKNLEAFKTGSLMSFSTFVAGLGAIFLTNSSVISEIAIILVTGLIVDYISTWITSSAMILWWIEKKNL